MDRIACTAPGGRMRLTLLGGFTLRAGGVAGRPADGELPRAVQRLVAQLGLAGPTDRTVVAGRLWPDVCEERAHASLRSALWRLRRSAPGIVAPSGGALSLAPGVRVDVRDLQAWAERVRDPRSGTAGTALPDPSLLGDLLPGWYDDWVLLERDRLLQVRLHALEAAAERMISAGRAGEALQAAHLAIRAEPLRESAHRTVVRAHLAEGNLAEALRAHAAFRDLLRRELGVPPTEQMTRLVQDIARPHRLAS
ncbi:BTAD domain-containing putative transcriptional regulator [Geodermatophilus sp. SYSU D00758]